VFIYFKANKTVYHYCNIHFLGFAYKKGRLFGEITSEQGWLNYTDDETARRRRSLHKHGIEINNTRQCRNLCQCCKAVENVYEGFC